jgi:hypothetical protein
MRERDDSRDLGQMATSADISFSCTDGIGAYARSSFQTNNFSLGGSRMTGFTTPHAPGSLAASICDRMDFA